MRSRDSELNARWGTICTLTAMTATEGNELVTNCHQLKLKAADGKRYNTDVANTEQILRVIQSVPSPKAEPFKMWLAR